MRVYGEPLELQVRALEFMSKAHVLEGAYGQPIAQTARGLLGCVRTAIVHSTSLLGRRKRPNRLPTFSLRQWLRFRADPKTREKKTVLALMRTLRRMQKGLPVTLEARISVVKYFEALSDECSHKADASSMAIGDTDD